MNEKTDRKQEILQAAIACFNELGIEATSIDAIRAANWNLDQKNPHVGETESHDPEHLLADYARLQGEAQALRDELKQILAQSLSSQR